VSERLGVSGVKLPGARGWEGVVDCAPAVGF
jgi:hypothetical protein